MSDAAHGELLEHPVYHHPGTVEPMFEMWDTPRNYRKRPGGAHLPDQIRVWRVQDPGKSYGSVVARYFGFTDSPDAEILAYGYNTGKEYRAVGIGRHGNILQWGYSGPPSQMTPAGRQLFLNGLWYIRQFEGRTPLVRRSASERTHALTLAGIITAVAEDRKQFFHRIFPASLYDRYGQDPTGLAKRYQDHLDLVYYDEVFHIDPDLKALGLTSNRSLATLEKLIVLLGEPDHSEKAQLLLRRYTHESFAIPEQWGRWLEENRGRIFFSDVGGYKFLVAPQGYLEWPE